MTDTTSKDIALPEEDMIGLEDFDPSTDAVMPTIRIDHNKGVFVDGLSNEEFPELKGILLGLIKQRVLWEAEMEENSKGPLCRSYDFKVGIPSDDFPWKASEFEKTAYEGDPRLPCADCKLKEWGSHPKRDTPWCSEQHTFALLQEIEPGVLTPALLTVQRSAIKPSKTYLTSFARSHTPLYTVWTKLTLDHRKRGTVNFAVPKFIRADTTNQEDWPQYAEQYRQIRTFVQTPRSRDDDETPSAAPTREPAPAAAGLDEDDLPF